MNTLDPERILEVSPEEFTPAIANLELDGYRLLMIKPADAPREALLRKPARELGRNQDALIRIRTAESFGTQKSLAASDDTSRVSRELQHYEWSIGRAGMMYRDLIPDRLGGKLIASHIRIVSGGTVADSVHYHKINFQVIYCLKGTIKVIYEDQGDPFWLRSGDCVLQPPEIRHRVLDAQAGSEVIEITSPAEHETWFDHELELPTAKFSPERDFGGQRFVLHKDADASFQSDSDSGIMRVKTAIPNVSTMRSTVRSHDFAFATLKPDFQCSVMIDGLGIRVDFVS